MDAASRAALAEARERLGELTQRPTGLLSRARDLVSASPRVLEADDLAGLADELFAVARLLQDQPSLRRALSDPAVKPADRAALAQRLLADKVSAATLDLVQTLARQRWSRPADLVDAAATLGTEAALDAADARGELESVEDELFRFGRIVAAEPELSRILGDRSAPAAGKTALLDRLLSGRVSPATEQLLRNHLTRPTVAHPETAIERLSEVASRRRGRSVAHVTAAAPLTGAQEQRLADVLGRVYGRAIGVQVTVDPAVLGGLVIRVGDEVIDGSVLRRLDEVGRRLVG